MGGGVNGREGGESREGPAFQASHGEEGRGREIGNGGALLRAKIAACLRNLGLLVPAFYRIPSSLVCRPLGLRGLIT